MTTTEQNKAIVREFIDGLFTKGDLGAVDTYLAEDFVNHDPPFGATAVFDKVGVRSRRELASTLLVSRHEQPATRPRPGGAP